MRCRYRSFGSRVERSGDRPAPRCGNNRQTGNMSVGFRPESRRLVSQKQIRLGIGSTTRVVYLLGHRQGPMGLSIPSRFRRAPCQPPSALAFDDLFLLHFSLSLSLSPLLFFRETTSQGRKWQKEIARTRPRVM